MGSVAGGGGRGGRAAGGGGAAPQEFMFGATPTQGELRRSLEEQGIVPDYVSSRGGRFQIEVGNELRAETRQALTEMRGGSGRMTVSTLSDTTGRRVARFTGNWRV